MRVLSPLLVYACVSLLVTGSTVQGQGILAPGAGPINQSMAGASTAASVDFGSSYWNPATLSGLEQDEALIGASVIIPSIHFSSAQRAGAIGGLLPPTNRYGTSRSDSGVASSPAVGAAWKLSPDSPVTFGLGLFGIAGGGVNFAGSYTTPVLGPRQPPNFFGVGPVFSNIAFLQIKPMVSLQVTDRLAVGFAPQIYTGQATLTPAFFAPGPRDQFGVPTFPSGTNARPVWGAGFEMGMVYNVNEAWNIGFSYRSPGWMGKVHYNANNPDLSSRSIAMQMGLPAVYSWGIAYKGIERLLVDMDLRYIDYANTPLLGDPVRDGGLNWKGVFAVATGLQYQLTDRLTMRGGYLYNTNPINSTQTLENIQAPGIITNTLSMGASYRLTENIMASGAWVHGFRNAIEGPIAQLPGTSTRLDAQIDSLVFGITLQFGAKRKTPGTRPTDTVPVPGPTQVASADSAQ